MLKYFHKLFLFYFVRQSLFLQVHNIDYQQKFYKIPLQMNEPIRKPCDAPATLLKYEPAVQIYESMRSYHQRSQQTCANDQNIPPKVEDVLNAIIPPRDWVDNLDKLYIQYISHQPASRQDVVELRSRLDKMLQDRQARNKGVCPIRQQLYSQAFDQIIRQVAVDCPERGLLLMRVRDEHRMTLTAYQTIYQSSVTFGMKKQVQSEEGADNLEEQVNNLFKKKEQLQDKRDLLICRKQLLQRQIRQRFNAESTKRQQQLKFLQTQTENLTKFLDIIKEELH